MANHVPEVACELEVGVVCRGSSSGSRGTRPALRYPPISGPGRVGVDEIQSRVSVQTCATNLWAALE
ncbi:hypothetical protein PoMZ_10555 [Pyricularia oryzae]|uniref:Uncharacterized protein n=1 Tax=Pyricularia oryzae TaxID=318829 RepID=A0A4V1C519_PYROR|nr:hypothetical protein PoMZ_10555 [Pyricularia oryzae]